MTIAEIAFIRDTFNLDSRTLAKALNVSPATVARWESGESEPTGLQAEVLRALHNVAMKVQDDETQRQAIAGLIVLGIGALIFYLLMREADFVNSGRTPRAGGSTSDGSSAPVAAPTRRG
jgi:transcriptional regulator with XRE-family HTH domain